MQFKQSALDVSEHDVRRGLGGKRRHTDCGQRTGGHAKNSENAKNVQLIKNSLSCPRDCHVHVRGF